MFLIFPQQRAEEIADDGRALLRAPGLAVGKVDVGDAEAGLVSFRPFEIATRVRHGLVK